jgi:cephalosporin hydroxylase
MSYKHIEGYSGFLPLYGAWVAQAKDGAIAVEVGVALGHSIAYLARQVIDSGKKIEVWGVDPFAGFARNGEQQSILGEKRTGDLRLFLDQMIAHAPEELEQVRILRATSVRAARVFRPGAVDLVLIDAAHDYDSVLEDIDTWAPRMRDGGWLCGDDFEPNYPGVERAVRKRFPPERVEVIGTAWRVKL